MKTKHTQGEWKLRSGNPKDLHIRLGEKGFVIAEVTSGIERYIGNQEEAEANARLIATAPELLAAAEKCRNLADICNNAMLPKSVQELLKCIETELEGVIKKATEI
jgi:hypothetical protein